MEGRESPPSIQLRSEDRPSDYWLGVNQDEGARGFRRQRELIGRKTMSKAPGRSERSPICRTRSHPRGHTKDATVLYFSIVFIKLRSIRGWPEPSMGSLLSECVHISRDPMGARCPDGNLSQKIRTHASLSTEREGVARHSRFFFTIPPRDWLMLCCEFFSTSPERWFTSNINNNSKIGGIRYA